MKNIITLKKDFKFFSNMYNKEINLYAKLTLIWLRDLKAGRYYMIIENDKGDIIQSFSEGYRGKKLNIKKIFKENINNIIVANVVAHKILENKKYIEL